MSVDRPPLVPNPTNLGTALCGGVAFYWTATQSEVRMGQEPSLKSTLCLWGHIEGAYAMIHFLIHFPHDAQIGSVIRNELRRAPWNVPHDAKVLPLPEGRPNEVVGVYSFHADARRIFGLPEFEARLFDLPAVQAAIYAKLPYFQALRLGGL